MQEKKSAGIKVRPCWLFKCPFTSIFEAWHQLLCFTGNYQKLVCFLFSVLIHSLLSKLTALSLPYLQFKSWHWWIATNIKQWAFIGRWWWYLDFSIFLWFHTEALQSHVRLSNILFCYCPLNKIKRHKLKREMYFCILLGK